MKVAYETVDVFTDRKFGGNPLAVIPDASGLSTEQMQAIAAEFNYAESTFVLPAQDPKNTANVRIFTPKAEMPFAGHPNVGTAFVLARMGRVTGDKLVFEEKAGLVPMDLMREGGTVVATRLAAPQPFALVEEIAPALVAEATGLKASDIVGQPVIASTGNNFLFAEVASRALGITLTKRGKHLGQDIPMCGVPVERADDYLHRLIALGHRVAWTPYAHFTHCEGASLTRRKPNVDEAAEFDRRWHDALGADPYYSPRLNDLLARIYEAR